MEPTWLVPHFEIMLYDDAQLASLYLEAAVSMAYQSIGYRRVKNPRIWSMHDIAVLSEKP